MSFVHQSITALSEEEFLDLLLAHPYYRESLFAIAGMPEGATAHRGGPWHDERGRVLGDVDILAVNPARPDLAVGIEAKRIKVRGDRINKLHEFGVAKKQANKLWAWGFSQVYLYVLLVADTREQNRGEFTYAGLTSEPRSKINSALSPMGLQTGVGLVVADFTQPMDHPPLGIGSSGLHLEQAASV